MKKLIFGHQNPDTDSICSSIAYGILKNKIHQNYEVGRLGEISKETQFVLDFLELEAPNLIEDVACCEVILVDHNEFGQSANNIEEAKIIEVIDHHRISNFQTKEQVYMNVQPVGCSATIVYEQFISNNIYVDKIVATLLLSAIMSDTLIFKSPTCTKKDVEVAEELEKIVDFDIKDFGLKMLKEGADLSDFSAQEIINIDAKSFKTDNGNFEVAQVNTADINEFLEKFETSLKETISETIASKNLDAYILMITDIINNNSELIVLGKELNVVEKAFKKELKNDKIYLEGVVSRKKQIVPFL